jgi:hypothetical protein
MIIFLCNSCIMSIGMVLLLRLSRCDTPVYWAWVNLHITSGSPNRCNHEMDGGRMHQFLRAPHPLRTLQH